MYERAARGDLAYPGFLRRVTPDQLEQRALLLRQLLPRLLPGHEKLRLAREDEATLPRLQVEHPLLEPMSGDQHVLRMQRAALSVAGILDREQQDSEAGADDKRERHAGKEHPLRYAAGVRIPRTTGAAPRKLPVRLMRQHYSQVSASAQGEGRFDRLGAVQVMARSRPARREVPRITPISRSKRLATNVSGGRWLLVIVPSGVGSGNGALCEDACRHDAARVAAPANPHGLPATPAGCTRRETSRGPTRRVRRVGVGTGGGDSKGGWDSCSLSLASNTRRSSCALRSLPGVVGAARAVPSVVPAALVSRRRTRPYECRRRAPFVAAQILTPGRYEDPPASSQRRASFARGRCVGLASSSTGQGRSAPVERAM